MWFGVFWLIYWSLLICFPYSQARPPPNPAITHKKINTSPHFTPHSCTPLHDTAKQRLYWGLARFSTYINLSKYTEYYRLHVYYMQIIHTVLRNTIKQPAKQHFSRSNLPLKAHYVLQSNHICIYMYLNHSPQLTRKPSRPCAT